MRHYVFYDASGNITGTCATTDTTAVVEPNPGEFVLEVDAPVDQDRDVVDVLAAAVLRGVKPAVTEQADDYARVRRNMYPSVEDQLDMLWHAMDENQMVRIEPFYSAIKAVKDAVPKDTEYVFDVGAQ